MKRLLVLLIGICLTLSSSFAAVNKTLRDAQEMLANASTLDEYKKAQMKFESAYSDPNYNEAEHKAAIEQGIKDCQAKITPSTAKITVNGSATPSVDFKADGGTLTLDVRAAKKGRIKAKSSEAWLSVENVGSDSIAITCEPNAGKAARTATVTVSVAGASVKVKVNQEFIEFVISDIMMSNTDAAGTEITAPGHLLISETALYLAPQFKISELLAPVEKNIRTRLYGPNRQLITSANSPEGYTDGKKIFLRTGENTVKFPGLGQDLPGWWPAGEYTLEIWIDDKREASEKFKIVTTGLSIWNVKFAAADKKGRQTSNYDATLYEEDLLRLKPCIIYCGVPEEKPYTLNVKVVRPDYTIDRNKKSPPNYSYAETAVLQPGTNAYELSAWGKGKKGAFPEGTYQFEIWDEKGLLLYTTKLYVASRNNPLSIYAVEYAAADSAGTTLTEFGDELDHANLPYLLPRIYYSGLTKNTKKDVRVKIFKPNGAMMRQPDSPADCTYVTTVRLVPGQQDIQLTAYGGTFRPGKYRIEYWVDGMLLLADTIAIK